MRRCWVGAKAEGGEREGGGHGCELAARQLFLVLEPALVATHPGSLGSSHHESDLVAPVGLPPLHLERIATLKCSSDRSR